MFGMSTKEHRYPRDIYLYSHTIVQRIWERLYTTQDRLTCLYSRMGELVVLCVLAGHFYIEKFKSSGKNLES